MKIKFTARLLASLEPQEKMYRVHDTLQPGLFIRMLPSGHASYLVTWGRNKAITIGRVHQVTLEQARADARKYLSEAHAHGEPLAVTQERNVTSMPTLESFLLDHFEPWAKAHQRDALNSLRAIRSSFVGLMKLRLNEIEARRIDQLRTAWLSDGLAPATANRSMTRLRGVFARAVDWGFLAVHPMTAVKSSKVDKLGRVRYLSPFEELSLRDAMQTREEAIRNERDSANKWRSDRKKELLPDLRKHEFADHLRPLVVLSLNTGMRRGEVFNLTWPDIDLVNNTVTVEGSTSKSGQTRHIQLNIEARWVMSEWKKQQSSEGFVFPGKSGFRLDNVNKSWRGLLAMAKVEAFRWHDLRHTFASKLAMAGVPLNTIRVLLGHSNLDMTVRYAHLAPDSTAAAVELLSLVFADQCQKSAEVSM